MTDSPADEPSDGAPGAARRPRLLLPILAGAAVIVALDQASKQWAVTNLQDRIIPILGSLRFRLSFNPGIAFSQGRGLTPLIIVVALLLVAGMLYVSRLVVRPSVAVAVATLLGGACGNLADRLFRDHGGAVVDFIDLQWWPIFNVADVAITTGALLLAVLSFGRQEMFEPRRTKVVEPVAGAENDA